MTDPQVWFITGASSGMALATARGTRASQSRPQTRKLC